MALGSQSDFVARLWKLLPPSWFPATSVYVPAILQGPATLFSYIYGLLKYAKAQTRVATASDAFLDIAAYDYTAARIQRRSGESDASFRERVIDEVLRIRDTRLGLIRSLTQLTCRPPQVFEPWNTNDSAAYGYAYYAGGPFPGVGFYGSQQLPFILFVQAYRPIAFSVPDAEIYAMANSVRAAGVTVYMALSN